MPVFKLPTNNLPQVFKVALGGNTYSLTLLWSTINHAWILDIADSTGTASIVSGIIVVAGTDLLAPYPYLGFGGALVAVTAGDVSIQPSLTTLGISSDLYFVTP
jgi:hypothetical protein